MNKPPIYIKLKTTDENVEEVNFFIGDQLIFDFLVLVDKNFVVNHNNRVIEFKYYSYKFALLKSQDKNLISVIMTNKNATLFLMRCLSDCEYVSHNDDKDQIQLLKDFLNNIY